jgi:hypothetical protein
MDFRILLSECVRVSYAGAWERVRLIAAMRNGTWRFILLAELCSAEAQDRLYTLAQKDL